MDSLDHALVATYIGANLDNWLAHRDKVFAAGYDVVPFYHWTPSKLLSTPGQPANAIVQLPNGDARFCAPEKGWSANTTSRWCSLLPTALKKVVNPTLEQRVPTAFKLASELRIPSRKIDELLSKHPDIPGSTSANLSHAACVWLRDNEPLWSGWVAKAKRAARTACPEPLPSDDSKSTWWVILLFIASVIICAASLALRVGRKPGITPPQPVTGQFRRLTFVGEVPNAVSGQCQIWSAKWTPVGDNDIVKVVVKVFPKHNLQKDQDIKELFTEFNVMRRASRSRRVVSLYGTFYQPTDLPSYSPGTLNLVMEQMERSLEDYLRDEKPRPLQDDEVKQRCYRILLDVALGLQDLEKFDILHRDIKPANILLVKAGAGAQYRAKVADFGLSRFLDGKTHVSTVHAGAGTPTYMAPELLHGEPNAARPAADVWSFGVVLWEVLTGRKLCKETTLLTDLTSKYWVHRQRSDPIRFVVSDPIQPILLEDDQYKDSEGRPAKQQTRATELLGKCLQFEPNFRPKYADLVSVLTRLTPTLCDENAEGAAPPLTQDQLTWMITVKTFKRELLDRGYIDTDRGKLWVDGVQEGMRAWVYGERAPKENDSMCIKALEYTMERRPDYKYNFEQNHFASFGIWGHEFKGCDLDEVGTLIMKAEGKIADGGAAGVKPVLCDRYVLKYLTVSEGPRMGELIKQAKQTVGERPTLITPTLFFFGELPWHLHSKEGCESFEIMQLSININFYLKLLIDEGVHGKISCFDMKGNFQYTNAQRKEDIKYRDKHFRVPIKPANMNIDIASVEILVYSSREAPVNQGTKLDVNFVKRFPGGLSLATIPGSSWHDQPMRDIFSADIRLLQETQLMDYSLFLSLLEVKQPRGATVAVDVDQIVANLVKAHPGAPVFKVTDKATRQPLGFAVMGIIDQLYHPDDRWSNDFSRTELMDLEKTADQWRKGKLPETFTPEAFLDKQELIRQYYGERSPESLMGGAMLDPHSYGERFLNMLNGDSKHAGFQYFSYERESITRLGAAGDDAGLVPEPEQRPQADLPGMIPSENP